MPDAPRPSSTDIEVPDGWRVGSPWFHDELNVWEVHARGPAIPGTSATEWTASAPTKDMAIAAMVRCLAELSAGRWPR